ncbi:MotE family protein [Roseomonas sp. BN140053]|uniref:MotE family protein n=1 Tax=Roseomonas sp. BN140053 TaxID=3391898 RepID=UPI0039EC692E
MRPRLRVLPALILGAGALAAAKGAALWHGWPAGVSAPAMVGAALISPAAASTPEPVTRRPAAVQPAAPPPPPAAEAPDPVAAAERSVLESLRGRRTALEEREQAMSAREAVLAAAERRLTARLEELAALQARLEGLERQRGEREEAGWRGLVKTYETMRPRDAAAVFDELEMPVLVGIVDRMREAKAAPVIGAMRPERARLLTAELARTRARASRPD